MVFVTVGSQKFPFDRLLKAVDALVADGIIKEDVLAQTGYSSYKSQHMRTVPFMEHEEFDHALDACSLLITHGGTGAIIAALKKGKKVLAMPRLARYGEHVDDHQVQLLIQFTGAELIEYCGEANELPGAYERCRAREYRRFESSNARFLTELDSYLSRCKAR